MNCKSFRGTGTTPSSSLITQSRTFRCDCRLPSPASSLLDRTAHCAASSPGPESCRCRQGLLCSIPRSWCRATHPPTNCLRAIHPTRLTAPPNRYKHTSDAHNELSPAEHHTKCLLRYDNTQPGRRFYDPPEQARYFAAIQRQSATSPIIAPYPEYSQEPRTDFA